MCPRCKNLILNPIDHEFCKFVTPTTSHKVPHKNTKYFDIKDSPHIEDSISFDLPMDDVSMIAEALEWMYQTKKEPYFDYLPSPARRNQIKSLCLMFRYASESSLREMGKDWK